MTTLLQSFGVPNWWLADGAPWADSKKAGGTPWSHAWFADPRICTFTSFPNQPTVADQIGSAALSPFSDSLGVDNAFPNAPLYYLKNTPTSTGHRYDSTIGSEAAGTAKPMTILLASYIPITPTAGYDPICFGSNVSSLRRLRVVANASSVAMRFERGTDAGVITSITWNRTTGPFVWVLVYNGASSFARENGVQVASGDLGGGACTTNTFCIGADRTTAVIEPCGQNIIGCMIASGVALTQAQYQPAETWFLRKMHL